jgi:hypothetical protein
MEQANEDSQRSMAVIVWLAFFLMSAGLGLMMAWGYIEQFKEAI